MYVISTWFQFSSKETVSFISKKHSKMPQILGKCPLSRQIELENMIGVRGK